MGYEENCIPTYLIIISENIPLFIQSKVGCFLTGPVELSVQASKFSQKTKLQKQNFYSKMENFLENLENDNSFLSPIDCNYKNGLIEISAVILLKPPFGIPKKTG